MYSNIPHFTVNATITGVEFPEAVKSSEASDIVFFAMQNQNPAGEAVVAAMHAVMDLVQHPGHWKNPFTTFAIHDDQGFDVRHWIAAAATFFHACEVQVEEVQGTGEFVVRSTGYAAW